MQTRFYFVKSVIHVYAYSTFNLHVIVSLKHIIDLVITHEIVTNPAFISYEMGVVMKWLLNTIVFQAEFTAVKVVRAVQTQGRNSPKHHQWVTTYKVGYSADCHTFTKVKDTSGNVKVMSFIYIFHASRCCVFRSYENKN